MKNYEPFIKNILEDWYLTVNYLFIKNNDLW